MANGALSLAQGGSFLAGFASGAVGQAAGMLTEDSPLGAVPGDEGKIVRSIFAGAAGGAEHRNGGGADEPGAVARDRGAAVREGAAVAAAARRGGRGGGDCSEFGLRFRSANFAKRG